MAWPNAFSLTPGSMTRLVLAGFALALMLTACDATASETSAAAHAAALLNSGQGQPNGECQYVEGGTRERTTQVTLVRTPSGTTILQCQFDAVVARGDGGVYTTEGFACLTGGSTVTTQSRYRQSPSGRATLTCSAR